MKKKILSVIFPVFFVAVYIYGTYSYYYEYLRWDDMLLVYLNAMLIAVSFGVCSLFSQLNSNKNSKKDVAIATAGGALSSIAVLFGVGFLVNNIIFKAAENEKAAAIIISVLTAVFGVILISLFVRLFKKSTAAKSVISAVLVLAVLVTGYQMCKRYMDLSFSYPIYRIFKPIGGTETQIDGINYTFDYSTKKVMPTDDLEKMADIDIKFAKNEWENFQFVVAATKKSEKITLEVSDFKSENGDILPVEVYKEHYIALQYPGGKMGNLYPDALIPIEADTVVELNKNKSQAFFVETRSEADTNAGEYTATLTLKNEKGEVALEKEIKATVWDFSLPESHYSETAMGIFGSKFFELAAKLPENLWGHNGGGYKEISQDQETVYKKYYDYLLSHGISAYNLPYDILDDRADEYMSDPRVKSFLIPYYEDDEVLAEAYKKVTSNPDWAKKGYFYPIDEPHTQEHFDSYNTIIERLNRVCPGFNMVTPFISLDIPEGSAINPYELQRDNNSILCPLLSCHESEEFTKDITTLSEMGKRSWWYVCCGPSDDTNMCNMFTFQQGIKHRTLFWQQYDYDVTGLLYWNVAYWDKCVNPWVNGKTWDEWEAAGDGMWIYPGADVGVDGPVGSLRLKNVAAGLEDYDYLRLAEEKFGKEWVDEKVAKITTSITEYNTDSSVFETVRREIGESLAE